MIEYKNILVVNEKEMDTVLALMNNDGYIFVNACPFGKGALYLLARQVQPQNTSNPTGSILTS